MNKVVVVSLLMFFLQGCSWDTNRKNLNNLEVGMSKTQVLEIMGNPYRREAEGQYEWLLYQTEEYDYAWQSESDYLTPLLIKDDILVGWGKNLWTTKEQKYDVKIDQTVKQE